MADEAPSKAPGVNECVQDQEDSRPPTGKGLRAIGVAAAVAVGGWLLSRNRPQEQAKQQDDEEEEAQDQHFSVERNAVATLEAQGTQDSSSQLQSDDRYARPESLEAGPHSNELIVDQEIPAWRRSLSNITSAVGSAFSTVKDGAGMAVGAAYSSWCQRVFEGGERHRMGGARRALAAGRGELLTPNRAGPRTSGDRIIEHELEIDVLCSKVVQDVYEDDCAELLAELGFGIVEIRDQDEDRWHPKWTVVRDKIRQLVLVVYRGTFSVTDAIQDLVCVPVSNDAGVKVHHGMHAGMIYSEEEVHVALVKALHGLKQARVIFTGHSYGGGCALLLRLHVLHAQHWIETLKEVRSVEAVTFGASHVFGSSTPEGASLLEQVHRSSRCYVHQGDAVPRLLGPKSGQLLSNLLSGPRQAEAVKNVIGAYKAFGSFRFIYTVQGEHRVRLVEDPGELAGLLEPPPLLFLVHAIQDHGTGPYFEKFQAIAERQSASPDVL